jgi:hypothetical protein
MSVGECLRQLDQVGPNVLFDVDYYRDTYGHAIPHGMTCIEHFCRQVRDRPCNPNPLFSTQQWHETIGNHLAERETWRSVLFETMGAEARFSREELGRQQRREVVLADTVTGAGPAPEQEICLFAHYDGQDGVQKYVLDYLDALRLEGVCIVFLTSCHALREQAQVALGGRVWRIVCSDNRARDWGLYAIGVRLLHELGVAGRPVILANDSVVGTMNSLSPLFAVARDGRYDITGAVDSLLHDWHLQSFFIYCKPAAVASPAWTGFWRAYRPHNDRWFVINGQEVGFSRWMTGHCVRMGSAWKYKEIIRSADNSTASDWRSHVLNGEIVVSPTTELWDVLLRAEFPFLKKAVFTTPLAAENLLEICNVLSSRGMRREYGD